MAHETHSEDKAISSASTASFWFVLVLAGLFVAAVNFVDVMGSGDEEHNEHGAVETAFPSREATAGGYLEGEGPIGKPTSDTVQHFPAEEAKEPAHNEAHH